MTGNLTLGQALLEGLETTAIGLSIVFIVLIILMFVLMLMKSVLYKNVVQETVGVVATPIKQQNSEPISMVTTENISSNIEDNMSEEELIAVLTAVVAASLNTSTYNLKIKSYTRTGNNSPVWNKAGLNDTINNRF